MVAFLFAEIWPERIVRLVVDGKTINLPVVINTIGPFTATMEPIARACLPCSHYIDLANDVISVAALLALHEEAVAAGRTLVTGAGFGVLATESVVLKLCQDRPTPDRVRTDALPSVSMEAGVIGEAFAATIIDGLPCGGRCYKHGRIVRNRFGSSLITILLPDGSRIATAGGPFGELVAAQRASGAPFVLAASSEIPAGLAVQALFPFAIALSSKATSLRNSWVYGILFYEESQT